LPLGKSGMKVTDALCHFTIAVWHFERESSWQRNSCFSDMRKHLNNHIRPWEWITCERKIQEIYGQKNHCEFAILDNVHTFPWCCLWCVSQTNWATNALEFSQMI
jgi:hypothetical protein